MSVYVAQVGPTLVALAAGWAILWSLRGRLGAALYHLSATTVGLVSFSVAAAVSTLLGVGFGWPVIIVSVAGLAAVVRALGGGADDTRTAGSAVPASSFVIMAVTLGAAGAAVAFAGATIATNDALVGFWPMAVELAREGAFTPAMFSARGALIPALGAVHVLMGADWAFVAYPLVALQVLMLVGLSVRRLGSDAGIGRAWRFAAFGAVGFLVLEPSFIFHALFVHSHMLSALFLLIAAIAFWRLEVRDVAGAGDGSAADGAAELMVAGFATAALALVRPDGIAYAMVPVAVAIARLTGPARDGRGTVAFFTASAGSVALVYVASFARLGLWETGKLNGRLALAVLAVLCVSSLLPAAVRYLARRTRFDLRSGRFLVAAVGVAVAAHAVLAAAMPRSLALSTANGVANLFGGGGGYGPLWYLLAGALVLSVLTRDATDTGGPRSSVFMTIVLFFLVASVVHAATHPGRIGDLDSFTRVAFHAVPLIVWYAAAVAVRILGDDRHRHG